ncbi:MAG: AarF/ABC1/UbiB kinase family protein [Polyangiaceae bacterium]
MSNDRMASERARLISTERSVPTSRLSRLWRAGRSAGALATATLGSRLRGKEGGLASADLKDIAQLVERLGELKGVAMKAGQILGYVDPSLPEELRGLLSLLHTASPASPFSEIEATVREALGERAEVLLAGMEREPFAVASIGQVHRGEVDGVKVAVKVRHPGIEEALASDFAAAGAGSVVARLMAPGAGGTVDESIQECKTAMLEECDFELEARRQAMFGRWFAGHPMIRVPEVMEGWCARSVLTTRWEGGLSLDELLATDPPQEVRDRLGVALFELYVGTLYKRGVFHADPHPGNYAFNAAGPLIVYDFGCVRSFDRETVLSLSRLVSAVRDDDMESIVAAFSALGAKPPVDEAGRGVLRALLREFFAPLLRAGVRKVEPGASLGGRDLLRDKKAMMRLSIPGKLLFLFRIRFGLYAVLARLGARADWALLESEWARGAAERGEGDQQSTGQMFASSPGSQKPSPQQSSGQVAGSPSLKAQKPSPQTGVLPQSAGQLPSSPALQTPSPQKLQSAGQLASSS